MQYSYAETSELTDAELVERARQADQGAFDVLVQRHRRRCVDLGKFFLRNESDAEDQVQIALLSAWEHLDQYHGDAEFYTWLARIVVNQCFAAMRVRRRAQLLHFDEVLLGPKAMSTSQRDPESELAYQELIHHLRTEIRFMPQILRHVIVLRDVRGLPTTEVAAQLGISVPCAKSRLVRARTELQLRMAKCQPKAEQPSPAETPLYRMRLALAACAA